MKIQCSCGSKYEFEVTPAMASQPVRFVCPACGLDASEFVDTLVRRELGQASTPRGVPVPIVVPPKAAATRKRVYDMLVADKMRVQGFHYPFPANGFVESVKTTNFANIELAPCLGGKDEPDH